MHVCKFVVDAVVVFVADPNQTTPVAQVIRDSGVLLLLKVLQPGTPTAIGASAHDPVLPTLALQYPGVTRLDCFLTWLRSAAVAAGVIDTPLPRYAKGMGVTDEFPHPYGNEHNNPYSPTLLFNPRYTGELLATLAEAQQFSIILQGLAIFYPNASMAHFVQGLRCLCADRYARRTRWKRMDRRGEVFMEPIPC